MPWASASPEPRSGARRRGDVPARPATARRCSARCPARGGRLSSDLWSSVPESGGSTRGAPIPLCHRSLNSALSSCPAPAAKMMAAPRPHQPHGMKLAEMKKATVVGRRKVAGKLEDVHQLRLLDNRYIQYRLLNTLERHRRPGPRLLRRRTPCSDWLRELLGYENQLLIRGQRLRRSRGIRDCAQLLVVRTSDCRSYLKKGLTIWLNVPLDALARTIAAVGSASRPLLHQQSGDPYAKAGGETVVGTLVKAALEKSMCKNKQS